MLRPLIVLTMLVLGFGPAAHGRTEESPEMRPIADLIAELQADDGAVRAAATREIFRRGKETLPDLKAAGVQIAPFGGTVDGTQRLSIVYSLIAGLPPKDPAARSGYRTDSFGLHVAKGVAAMGKKHGFVLGDNPFRLDGRPNCYVTLEKGKSLAAVITSVLASEPGVNGINLNYFEQ